VNARPESWPRPADPQGAALAALLAIALFFGTWGVMHQWFYARSHIVDTPVYQRYGDAMAHGKVPYRDFRVEYPPGALPMFVLPSLGHTGDFDAFRRIFEALMAICGAAAVAFVEVALLGLGAGRGRLVAGLGFAALAPLALGSVVLSRFDLWPAALTAAALAALVVGRERLGFGALGLAVAAKIYPGVLLPLAIAYVWRRSGRREALISLGVFGGVLAACFAPFLALAPHGVWESVVRQANRPLQIESLGASLLLVLHQIGGVAITMRPSHGSQNLAGTAPDVLAGIQSALQVGVLLGLWIAFARGPADRERLVRMSAAAVCAFIALGKVLSPQFLIWLVPLVPLVRRRRGLACAGLLAAAMVLTQLWFPFRYWRLALSFDEISSWLVFLRDLVLLGLLCALAWPERVRAGSGSPRSP